MQGTTRRWDRQWGLWLHGLAVLSLVGLALLGQVPLEVAGWPIGAKLPGVGGGRRVLASGVRWAAWAVHLGTVGWYLAESWPPVLVRSLVLWGLWAGSQGWGPAWLRLMPWGLWLWRGLAAGWPGLYAWPLWAGLERGLWQGQRVALVAYLGVLLGRLAPGGTWPWGVSLSCLLCASDEPRVRVVRAADGSYQVELCGHFTLQVAGDHPFRMRLLVLVLSLLDVPDTRRGSRRTRDGRMPFVRQVQLAEWFGVPQPNISRWLRYWQAANWADLLSLQTAEVLTGELVARIVQAWATFPTWSAEQVYQHLRQQGLAVTQAQVAQAAAQSGWDQLRQTLLERYDLAGGVLRLRDTWLVGQLLRQLHDLLARLESGAGLPAEVASTVQDVTALAATASGLTLPLLAVPWLRRVEQLVLQPCPPGSAEQVCCPNCGSDQVGRKSAQPRWKKYYDASGQLQQVAVYRYYCRNPQCAQASFTHLPAGLVPYSPYRTELHLLALQMYAWGYANYRRTGAALGVTSLTVWRWVSAWGYDLLPIAALCGLVRSSGVVGVDEKYVLVPKNDKPAGKMRRWMYVYLAVDVWTYDLLHIAIYAYNDENSAETFLLALRAQGYHPQVIVTDLRQDYGPVIQGVFPQAIQHLCIFHALKDAHQHIRDVYGPDYADHYPPAETLRHHIDAIFDAETLALATQRYTNVLALRPDYLQAQPEAAKIFDFLERHWPQLANSIGSSTIPATNNTVELVIRRFDQHYQNFCGFESLEDAQRYLAVFEKIYRFTPFSQDAQPRIRGRSPLQLAGYDLANLPMTTLCSGLSILWPTQTTQAQHVPTS